MSPRPLLWFAIGVGAATWYNHHQTHCTQNQGESQKSSSWWKRHEWRSGNCDSHMTWAQQRAQQRQNAAANASGAQGSSPAVSQYQNEIQRARKENELGDKVIEVSEATLDMVLDLTEALREKLVAHRAQREAQNQADLPRDAMNRSRSMGDISTAEQPERW